MRKHLVVAILALAAVLLAGCDTQLRKSDTELGLNPRQASGRRVFDRYCATCHEAYSAKSWRGPSLQGVFKKQFMPSGTPANDDRVREVITLGRSKMPAFGRVLDQPQMDDLLAYLHTL
ncbi:MAG: cytochrome c [Acidobacteriia bacterium]|nr:cytochrome c [Terriglobia bacterium]